MGWGARGHKWEYRYFWGSPFAALADSVFALSETLWVCYSSISLWSWATKSWGLPGRCSVCLKRLYTVSPRISLEPARVSGKVPQSSLPLTPLPDITHPRTATGIAIAWGTAAAAAFASTELQMLIVIFGARRYRCTPYKNVNCLLNSGHPGNLENPTVSRAFWHQVPLERLTPPSLQTASANS